MYLATSFLAELGGDCDLLIKVEAFVPPKIIPPSTRHLACFIIDGVVQFFVFISFLLTYAESISRAITVYLGWKNLGIMRRDV